MWTRIFGRALLLTLDDGGRIEVEEAVVIRPAPPQGGSDMLRATFFGIDVADAAYCYNLVKSRVRDRRGTIYFTFRSHQRADLGTTDFRRALRNGKLRYNIEKGRLQETEIGGEAREPRVVSFDGEGVELLVSDVKRGSDADKLLSQHTPLPKIAPRDQRLPRRLVFEIQGPDEFSWTGYFIEDSKRWR
jgi:hypothetical protein